MGKHYTNEQKRLAVIMFKMQSCVEHYLKELATLYPEVTELSGFASLEIKRYMMLIYINGVMESQHTKELMTYLEVLINSINKSITKDELEENTKPPTMNFN